MLSSSAVGATGPEGNYAGYAPTFACLSGIASISGHPDEPPTALSGSVDLRVGTSSAFAVLAALRHRQLTGEGQNIDVSSTEVMTSMMGEALLGYQLSGRLPERVGNRNEGMAPHGCYRTLCEEDGEGEWITIAVGSDAEWEAFRGVIGVDEPEFASTSSRLENQEALDERVEAWTRQHEVDDAVARLQSAGVAAARLHTGATLSRDPHVLAREVFVRSTHPLMGEKRVVRPPWRMEGAHVEAASPLLGEHNEYVLGDIVGLSAEEIARLVEEEAVY
jgi:benzylsuccinate CoA-transferase BbsF subunit